jgi:hypothetical protein
MRLSRTKDFVPRREVWQWLWLFVISAPAAVAAYYLMFIRPVNFNDDEGTMMMSAKEYLAGLRLYDQIFSSYGPVYYFYGWFVHFVSRTAVTHDTTRMTTVVMWTVCALISALIILRFTKSLVIAAVTHILIFMNLAFFGNEPGTVQELCMLLLLGLAASGFLVQRHHSIAMILVGVLTAGLLLIKVNIGVFVILAAAMAILFYLPAGFLSRAGRVAVCIAALALPFVLMRAHLDDSQTRVYWFVVTVSTAALLLSLLYAGKGLSLELRDCSTV